EVVDKLVEINKEFKKEDLIKESEEMLGMRVEYETKMSKTTTEAAIVETEVKESSKDFELVESKDGSVTLSESAYKAFNEEIKKNI
ncbi:hypothetical protein KAR91_67050, partial [Candidatus Pacearchaeota archaeon]|nr:hypothetical protein [Candidatus Pacearchaeota archaeon]